MQKTQPADCDYPDADGLSTMPTEPGRPTAFPSAQPGGFVHCCHSNGVAMQHSRQTAPAVREYLQLCRSEKQHKKLTVPAPRSELTSDQPPYDAKLGMPRVPAPRVV